MIIIVVLIGATNFPIVQLSKNKICTNIAIVVRVQATILQEYFSRVNFKAVQKSIFLFFLYSFVSHSVTTIKLSTIIQRVKTRAKETILLNV